MNALLSVRQLKKYFATRDGMLHAVDDVSFDIERGTTLGIVGESGCGKSTLGRVILHLLPVTSGRIVFEGEDISNITSARLHELRRNMQIIFQDPFSSIDPRMSVREILGEPLDIYRAWKNQEERDRRIRDIMDIVGLARRFDNSYAHELDGGRRQRIGIGRALMLNPKFIVCDEPVSALDVSIQAQILNLMQDLQAQMDLTYIFISHNLSVVRHVSDRIAVMYMGVIVEQSDTKDLFVRPYHPYTKALLSAIPRISLDERPNRIILRREVTSPIEPPHACRFAPRCNCVEEICLQKPPGLVEVDEGHLVACHLTREIKNGIRAG